MNIDDFFCYYKEKTIPVYADFIAVAGYKPEQILIEESNALAHIGQYFNLSISQKERVANLQKAINHLHRLTLDLHKLVWYETSIILDVVVLSNKKRLAFNISDSEIFNKYSDFIAGARKMRAFELNNIGCDLEAVAKEYDKVNIIGKELLENLDQIKLATIEKWEKWLTPKSFIISSIAAFVIGLLANYASKCLF